MAFSTPVVGCLVKRGLQKGGSRAPQDPSWLRPYKFMKVQELSFYAPYRWFSHVVIAAMLVDENKRFLIRDL